MAVALVTRNKLSLIEAAYCILSQVLGAFTAGLVAYGLYNNQFDQLGYPHSTAGNRRGQAFLAETIQTFALATTVLNTATTEVQSNNSYFGIAIGFVVLAGALTVGPISGGSFNPAGKQSIPSLPRFQLITYKTSTFSILNTANYNRLILVILVRFCQFLCSQSFSKIGTVCGRSSLAHLPEL